jgi:hypothetical protein
MEPTRFIIACGPTGIREGMVNEMGRRFPEELACKVYNYHGDEHYMGVNTDYRWELKAAVDHATWENKNGMPTIFSHSLLDSLAYVTLAVERHAKFDNVSDYERDKTILMFGLVGAMFRDSFRGDVFFIEAWQEGDGVAYEVQERIRLILDEFGIGYTVFAPDKDGSAERDWYDQAEAIIRNVLDAEGDGN